MSEANANFLHRSINRNDQPLIAIVICFQGTKRWRSYPWTFPLNRGDINYFPRKIPPFFFSTLNLQFVSIHRHLSEGSQIEIVLRINSFLVDRILVLEREADLRSVSFLFFVPLISLSLSLVEIIFENYCAIIF